MFRRSFILILVTFMIKLNDSVTIRFESQPTFPKILPKYDDVNSFIRIRDNKKEVLNCPDDFIFDDEELKCVFNGAKYDNNKVETVKCVENYAGTLPNPKNCRTYVDCWYGSGYIMPCPEHLLFNNVTKQCDWPETAQCCEFWEENESQLVSDM